MRVASPIRRFGCLLLVAFFAWGQAAYGHSLEHGLASLPEAGAHHHSEGHGRETGPPLEDLGHLLIHLNPAMELAVFGAEPDCSSASGYSTTLATPPSVEPRHVALEPPLRPPRASA